MTRTDEKTIRSLFLPPTPSLYTMADVEDDGRLNITLCFPLPHYILHNRADLIQTEDRAIMKDVVREWETEQSILDIFVDALADAATGFSFGDRDPVVVKICCVSARAGIEGFARSIGCDVKVTLRMGKDRKHVYASDGIVVVSAGKMNADFAHTKGGRGALRPLPSDGYLTDERDSWPGSEVATWEAVQALAQPGDGRRNDTSEHDPTTRTCAPMPSHTAKPHRRNPHPFFQSAGIKSFS